MALIEEYLERYRRQLMLTEVGMEGQAKLGRSKAVVCGLGGLGSAASLYLAAAGIGCLRLIDKDRVEISNLNRQILHTTEDIGREKCVSGAEKLIRLNPGCRIEAVTVRLTMDNARSLVEGFDVIIDATDNLEARRALNRASLQAKIPMIHGAVGGFNGMIAVFFPQKGPCLECIFPARREKEGGGGILGPVAGIIGCFQALEAVKILLGGSRSGRLLYLYGSDMKWKEIEISRNPDCEVCKEDYGREL